MGKSQSVVAAFVIALALTTTAFAQPLSSEPPSTDNRGPIKVQIVEDAADRAANASERAEARLQERSDLATQRTAASAAVRSADWTKISAIIAGLGTLAAAVAGGMAISANRTASRALSVSIQAERAHVLIEEAQLGHHDVDGKKTFCVVFNARNRGRSPAWLIGTGFVPVFGVDDLPKDPPLFPTTSHRVYPIAPDGHERIIVDLDGMDDFEWSQNLFIVGVLCYRDMFGTIRETRFAFKNIMHGGPRGADTLTTWGNPDYWHYT